MYPVLFVIVVLLVAAVSVLLRLYRRERAIRKERELAANWPIAPVSAHEVDPAFRPGPFGPGLASEVAFVGRGAYQVDGGTSDAEAWMLAVLAKRAHRLFEFGTCTGKTAYLWARNAPPGARVTTLTLAPDDRREYHREPTDDEDDTEAALSESGYRSFLYSGTPVESRVEQLFGDSKALDVTPWAGRCDVVFVDGSHAYSYVVNDSAKALQLVRPGGLILWHDYAGPRHSPGVYRALNELAERLPLRRIAGTMLVVYRKPEAAARSA
jgi:hypothetical protein